jgi:hypothetical protein
MWMCHHNRLQLQLNEQRGTNLCYNLTELVDLRLAMEKVRCENDRDNFRHADKICPLLESNEDPYKACRSVSALLESSEYNRSFHDMTLPLVPGLAETDVSARTEANVELAALRYLGGIEKPNRTDTASMHDVMWFGITERMDESMCLLSYMLRKPFATIPRERVIEECKPSSYWSSEDRAIVRQREGLDYAVHRVANAILDVRLERMRRELYTRSDSNETLPCV